MCACALCASWALVLQGLTLRQIGVHIGRSPETVRQYLLKSQHRQPEYLHSVVSRTLISRILESVRNLDIAPTPENKRRLKHCVSMLRRHRPLIYWRLHAKAEAMRPTSCATCARTLQVRPLGDRWLWTCQDCDTSGVVVRPSIAELLIRRTWSAKRRREAARCVAG